MNLWEEIEHATPDHPLHRLAREWLQGHPDACEAFRRELVRYVTGQLGSIEEEPPACLTDAECECATCTRYMDLFAALDYLTEEDPL